MASSSSNGGGGGVPPGFRFHPTDEELLHYYLKKKVSFEKFEMEVIREVDLNKIEPWDLQGTYLLLLYSVMILLNYSTLVVYTDTVLQLSGNKEYFSKS